MDRTSLSGSGPTHPVRRIGFVGTGELDPYEEGVLYHIGRCIARLGHTIVTTNENKGNVSLRKGVKREKGLVDTIETGVIESSDHTLIYSNDNLHQRLKEKYEDLEERNDVLLLTSKNIDEWHDAVIETLKERGVDIPTHGGLD